LQNDAVVFNYELTGSYEEEKTSRSFIPLFLVFSAIVFTVLQWSTACLEHAITGRSSVFTQYFSEVFQSSLKI